MIEFFFTIYGAGENQPAANSGEVLDLKLVEHLHRKNLVISPTDIKNIFTDPNNIPI